MQNAKCKMQIIIIVGLAMILFSMNNAFSNELILPLCADIDSVYITGGTTIGDTIFVHSIFTAKVSSKFNLGVRFGQGVRLLGTPDSVHLKFQKLQLDSNQTVNITTPFVITDTVNTLFSLSGFLDESQLAKLTNPRGPEKNTIFVSKWKNALGEPMFPNSSNTLDEPNTSQIDYKAGGEPELITLSQGSHKFSIKGKVTFINTFDNIEKGTFARVRLYFRAKHSNDPQTAIMLPNVVQNEYIQGVHYADCNEKGEYEFNFTTDFGSFSQVDYYIVVEKKNLGVDVFSIANHLEIPSMLNPAIKFRVFPYNGCSKSVDLTTTIHNYVDQNIMINPADGCFLRYCTLAKMFLKDRLNVSDYSQFPFNQNAVGDRLPPVRGQRMGSGPNGEYNSGDIYFVGAVSNQGIGHEYGHYVDHAMASFGSLHPLGGYDGGNNTEAFAMFFNGAFKAWNNAIYGNSYLDPSLGRHQQEEIDIIENAEFAPTYRWIETNRGWNMHKGWLPIASNPGGAFATFLSNLYDSQDEGRFTAEYLYYVWFNDVKYTFPTRGYNNDDIELGRLVFDLWIQQPNDTWEQFRDLVLANVSNYRLQTSITNMYNFLNTDNFNATLPNPAKCKISLDMNNKTLRFISGSYKYSDIDQDLLDTRDFTYSYGHWETYYVTKETSGSKIRTPFLITNTDKWNGYKDIPFSSIGFSDNNRLIECFAARSNDIPYDAQETWNPTIPDLAIPLPKVSLDNNLYSYNTSVYPNPVVKTTTVKINTLENSTANINIIDLSGNVVLSISNYKLNIGQNDIKFDISNFTSANYIIKIELLNEAGVSFNSNINIIKID